ncbi:AAWKG family protein [Streptomyces zingiberis]|uniref:Cell surface protein n=1 Tax=Streptomyces zingiberis TaxID=2053010 RepID=A0ABX1C5N5_9ACTN|nr:AAWKG family protein [Streptomyces zingiberis]NJQ02994.1 cell surface protein [Streptomyces zingiberis]
MADDIVFPASSLDDYWHTAVRVLTGYDAPKRETVFGKLLGNDSIPQMRVEFSDYHGEPSNAIVEAVDDMSWRQENSGWRISNTDFVVPFYSGKSGSIGDAGVDTRVKMKKARVTMLGNKGVDDPPEHGVIFEGSEFKSGLGKDFQGQSKDTVWSNVALSQYSFGTGKALQHLMNEGTTQGFSWNDVSVSEANAVDLDSFTLNAEAFDRVALFFDARARELRDWEFDLGKQEMAWKGQAAGVFKDIIHALVRNYESYSEQFPKSGSRSTYGNDLRQFKTDVEKAVRTLYNKWDLWRQKNGNPLRHLHDVLLDVTDEVWENNIKKVRYKPVYNYSTYGSYDSGYHYVKYDGFYGGARSFGPLEDKETWKKIGEEGIRRWQNSIRETLEPAAKQALIDVENAFNDQSFPKKVTTETVNLTQKLATDQAAADREQARKDKEEAERKAEEKEKEQEEKEKEAERKAEEKEAEWERKQEEKEAEAEAKQAELEAKQEEKEREAEAKAAEKEAEAEAKQAEQEAKQAEKEAEQEAKQAEQEAKAEQRQAEAEAKQAEKEAEQEAKQAEQEAKAEQRQQEAEAKQAEQEARAEAKQAEQEAKQAEAEQRAEERQVFATMQARADRDEQKREQDKRQAEAEAKQEEAEAEARQRQEEQEAKQAEKEAEQEAKQAEQEAKQEQKEKEAEQRQLQAEQEAERRQTEAEAKQEEKEAEQEAKQAEQEAKAEQRQQEAEQRAEQAQEEAEARQAEQEAKQEQRQQEAEQRAEQQQEEALSRQAEQEARQERLQQEAEQRSEKAQSDAEAKQAEQEALQEKRQAEAEQRAEQQQREAQERFSRQSGGGLGGGPGGDLGGPGSLDLPPGNSSFSPDMATTTFNSDGTVTIDQPDGSSRTIDLPSGDVVTTRPDGTSFTESLSPGDSLANSDGSTTTLNPDGTLTTRFPDGSSSVLDPEQGTITTRQPDGTSVSSPISPGQTLPSSLGSALPGGGSGNGSLYSPGFNNFEEELYDSIPRSGGGSDYGMGAGNGMGGGMPMLPPGTRINGSTTGGSGGDGERVRAVMDDGQPVTRRSQGGRQEETVTAATRGGASTMGGMPFMPPMGGGMGGAGGAGGQPQTESGGRERASWVEEDEDVWGTDEGGAPAVIGR